jgi:hypothetical protein
MKKSIPQFYSNFARYLFQTLDLNERSYIKKMDKIQLNRHSIGLFKKELISKGFIIEESPQPIGEVNFLASKKGKTLKIKVRSISQIGGYIFIEKSKFDVDDQSLYMAVLYLPDNEKESVLYLLPAVDWSKKVYPLSGKDYSKPNQKSLPEWGISYSQKAKDALEAYRFDKVIKLLLL